MDGNIRRAVAEDPSKFSYAPEADTATPGKLTGELKSEGDARISGTVVPPPVASQPETPAAPQTQVQTPGQPMSFQVVYEAKDAEGFTTQRSVSVQAPDAAAAGDRPSQDSGLERGLEPQECQTNL